MDTGKRKEKQINRWGFPVDVNSREFAAKVRAKIGGPYQHLVDPSVAQNVMDPQGVYSLLGVNVGYKHDAFGQNPEARSRGDRERLLRGLGISDADLDKYILGVGAGASPATFAHEFRHNEVLNENANRLEDVKYATSPEDYAISIQDAYEHLTRSRGEDVPFKEKERYVLEQFYGQQNQIERHVGINNYEPYAKIMDFLSHPIDTITGERKTGKYGTLARGTYKERAEEPFLNFVGSPNLPDPLNTTIERKLTQRSKEARALSEEMSDVQAEANRLAEERKKKFDELTKNKKKTEKKADGGSVTMPENYRSGGRVRMI